MSESHSSKKVMSGPNTAINPYLERNNVQPVAAVSVESPTRNADDYVDAAIKYLTMQYPFTTATQQALTDMALGTSNFLSSGVKGMDVIRITEGAQGIDGKPWKLKFEFDDVLMGDLSRVGKHARNPLNPNLERVNSPYVGRILDSIVNVTVNKYLHDEYIPEDTNRNLLRRGKYPDRKLEVGEATARLITKQGFVDVPISVLKLMLVDGYTDNNSRVTSGLEKFLIEGKSDVISGSYYGYTVHPMEDWDKVRNALKEPPLLTLSISQEGNPLAFNDPKIFVHANLEITREGNLPKCLNLELSHAIDAVPAMENLLIPAITQVFEDDEVKEKPNLEEDLKDAHVFFDAINPTKELYGGKNDLAVAKESFGGDVLMEEIARKFGILQFDTTALVPSRVQKFILSHSSFYGGMSGISTLSGLDLSGQSVMFPLANKEKGLQVCLGLGGTGLMLNLRDGLKIIAAKKGTADFIEPEFRRLNDLVWKFWQDNKLTQTFKDEIERGREGHGTMTTLSSATGIRGRDIVTNLSKIVVPGLVVKTQSKISVSLLGNAAQSISKFGNLDFFTSRNKDNSIVFGEVGNVITGQFFARDPIIWAEAITKLVEYNEQHPDLLLVENLAKAWQSINENPSIKSKYGLNDKEFTKVGTWIYGLLDGGKVSQQNIGKIHIQNEDLKNVNANVYFGTMGEDAEIRADVINTARVLVALFKTAEEPQRGLWKGGQLLEIALGSLVKQKMVNYVNGKVKLAILEELRQLHDLPQEQFALGKKYDELNKVLKWSHDVGVLSGDFVNESLNGFKKPASQEFTGMKGANLASLADRVKSV